MRVFVLWLAAVLIAGPALAGNTKECEAVDSLSVVGFHDFDTVAMAADEDDRECRFSINGATAGSPPQEEVSAAFRQLIGGFGAPGSFLASREIDFEALALLMLAAGPDRDAGELVEILSEFSFEIDDCRNAASDNATVVSQTDDDFFCAAFGAGSQPDNPRFGPASGRFDGPLSVPRFEIAVRRGGLVNYLSFPLRR